MHIEGGTTVLEKLHFNRENTQRQLVCLSDYRDLIDCQVVNAEAKVGKVQALVAQPEQEERRLQALVTDQGSGVQDQMLASCEELTREKRDLITRDNNIEDVDLNWPEEQLDLAEKRQEKIAELGVELEEFEGKLVS